MIADGQHYSRHSSQQIFLQDISEHVQEQLPSPEIQTQPILERYRNDYQIFKQGQLELAEICQFKNKTDCLVKRKTLQTYFTGTTKIKLQHKQNKKEVGQISSQFLPNLNKLPPYSIIYASIFEVEDNRFNLIIRNGRGQCIAYVWRLRKSKKLAKILKMLGSIKKPVLAVILDRAREAEANIPEIMKLNDVISEFVYIFQNGENLSVKMEGSQLRSELSNATDISCTIHRTKSELIINSLNLFPIRETDQINNFIGLINRFEYEDQQILQLARGHKVENENNLEFDILFMTVYRSYSCSTIEQTLLIIQQLFTKQQQNFNRLQEQQKQKQIQRNNNKDPNSHYPEKIGESKACKRCEYTYKKKFKKTSVKCQGCSVTLKKDIPLCPECFADFHQRYDFFVSRIQTRSRANKRYKHLQTRKIKRLLGANLSRPQVDTLQKKPQPVVKNEHLIYGPNEVVNGSTVQKALRMDAQIDSTFEIVKKLENQGYIDIIQLFLGAYVDTCLQRMKKFATTFPQLDQGMTKMGADTMKIIEDQKRHYQLELQEQNMGQQVQNISGCEENEKQPIKQQDSDSDSSFSC